MNLQPWASKGSILWKLIQPGKNIWIHFPSLGDLEVGYTVISILCRPSSSQASLSHRWANKDFNDGPSSVGRLCFSFQRTTPFTLPTLYRGTRCTCRKSQSKTCVLQWKISAGVCSGRGGDMMFFGQCFPCLWCCPDLPDHTLCMKGMKVKSERGCWLVWCWQCTFDKANL